MNKLGYLLSTVAGAGLALLLSPADAAKPVPKDGEAEKAAREFLASLPADLRADASFAADAKS